MLEFKRVENIKITYLKTDYKYENIYYRFDLGDDTENFGYDDWQDIAPFLLKLYVKAKNRENYRCFEELAGYFYHVFRLVNIEKDRIILRVWLNRGDYGVE